MKVRHAQIDGHIRGHEKYEDLVNILREMYGSSSDASMIRFMEGVQDVFRSEVESRSGRGETSQGEGWRREQKDAFSGRGAKWVKVDKDSEVWTGLVAKLSEWEELGESVESYRVNINQAGYAWMRYSGPRADNMAAFEVRIGGSKIDHPKHLYLVKGDIATSLEKLGGTPVSRSLES